MECEKMNQLNQLSTIYRLQYTCTSEAAPSYDISTWRVKRCPEERPLTCDMESPGAAGPTERQTISPSSHSKFAFFGVVSGVGGRTEISGTSVGENGSATDLVRPTVAFRAVIPIRTRGPQLSSLSSSSSRPGNRAVTWDSLWDERHVSHRQVSRQTHTHCGRCTRDKRAADGTNQTQSALHVVTFVFKHLSHRGTKSSSWVRMKSTRSVCGKKVTTCFTSESVANRLPAGTFRTKLLYTGCSSAGLLLVYFVRGSEQGRGSL